MMWLDRRGRRYWRGRAFHRCVFPSFIDAGAGNRFELWVPTLSCWCKWGWKIPAPPLLKALQTSNMNHVSAHQINFLVWAGLLSHSLHLLLRPMLLFCFFSLLVTIVFFEMKKTKWRERLTEGFRWNPQWASSIQLTCLSRPSLLIWWQSYCLKVQLVSKFPRIGKFSFIHLYRWTFNRLLGLNAGPLNVRPTQISSL